MLRAVRLRGRVRGVFGGVKQRAWRTLHTQRPAQQSVLAKGADLTKAGIWGELLILGVLTAAGLYATQQWHPLHQARTADTALAQARTLPDVPLISYSELRKHNTRSSCWILVRGQVYDVTDFLNKHPAGADIIVANSGGDATSIFRRFHPPGLLDSLLAPSQHLGAIDPSTLPASVAGASTQLTEDEERVERARREIPPVDACVSVQDLEDVARHVMSKVAWGYCMSGADTESAYKNNRAAFAHYTFRPRVLRSVAEVDTSCVVLGHPSSLPIYVSPAANVGLGHPSGEVGITRGSLPRGIIQGVAAASSRSLAELEQARHELARKEEGGGEGTMFFQFYMNKDRGVSEKQLREAEERGFRAVFLTVDTAVPGKRELDLKTRGLPPAVPVSKGEEGKKSATQKGIANSLGDYFDANLQWSDLPWIRSVTKMPIILKGVQTVEDVELAVQNGCVAVVLSNHGGRQLDYARAPIDILYDLRQRRPDILESKKIEIYVDSGFRRGTDVVKALCLGATAVGLGRPFWYANAAYGEEGVGKLVDIMREEIATAMRLLGVTKLSELKPEMVVRTKVFDPRKPWHLQQS